LKSQKGLISFCEFERKEIEKDGKKKIIGMRVTPKSSPLFQEFKIWQNLHNLIMKQGSISSKDEPKLATEAKEALFEELNLKGNLKSERLIEILGYKPKEFKLNYTQLEGNRTNQALYNAYLKILEIEGYNEDLLKLSDKDDININELKTPTAEIKSMVKAIFEVLGINTAILEFDAELEGKAFENQASYQLWHLLYSAEDDIKKYNETDILLYGNDNIGLKKQLCAKFGFKPDHAKILANVVFQDDYGSLSTKAMRKIYPYIKENKYSEACELAGYRHSKHSLTKEEIESRTLKPKLDLLQKNSLRNPVVEKILNQMVNVVNTLIDKENTKLKSEGKEPNFQFDEIRIELSRELKKNAAERAEMTTNINAAKTAHEKIYKLLQSEFGLKNPTRNDIIRYKLYEELKNNGYKDLYTDTYIPREKLFTKEIDIEHIIPQSRLFDDSFSNKTVVFRKDNLEKGNQTAIEYIESKFGENGLAKYQQRVDNLFEQGKKNKEEGISKAKYQKLLKRSSEIGEGFIERDLRDSQYIAKKAKEILFGITRSVVSTSGQITDRLREDWGLVNIMKELNLPKYRVLGLTEM
ncbi:MAG: type II CRISPR RNA-guided endonuclease Cas9, partial [Bacteroidetes bacterium]|nr:type II CRISPR RNA-guided endonuclease Cas9 [Bacteroidota bacterium]